MKYYLAVDIGASSGRHIIGYKDNNKIITDEVYRFKNNVVLDGDHLIWDVEYLFNEIVNGIKTAFAKYEKIESMSIDTWGVDYVLMDNDKEIFPCYAYRDDRCDKVIDKVHEKISFRELYQITGCQFQKFNTLYQLYDDKLHHRLDHASDFLMMPEYFIYKLTGVKVKEYTNATTSGMVDLNSNEYSEDIINRLKLPNHLFTKLSKPKAVVGYLKDDIVNIVNGNLKVVLCATHDTASAVEGIDMEDDELYISSGTWSLLGTKIKHGISTVDSMNNNYTNEGGIGYIRYQKNIMGMWVVNCLQKELCPDLKFDEIVKLAKDSTYDKYLDINGEAFFAPKSMKDEFDKLLNDDLSVGDYFRCAYVSLAMGYKKAIEEIEMITKRHYHKLYIVGGGAKNSFLNDLCVKYTNKQIIALPIEATAIGNLKVQMEE